MKMTKTTTAEAMTRSARRRRAEDTARRSAAVVEPPPLKAEDFSLEKKKEDKMKPLVRLAEHLSFFSYLSSAFAAPPPPLLQIAHLGVGGSGARLRHSLPLPGHFGGPGGEERRYSRSPGPFLLSVFSLQSSSSSSTAAAALLLWSSLRSCTVNEEAD